MEKPRWKLLTKKKDQPTDIVFRIYNGKTESMSVESEEYKQWLEEGNTPLLADDNGGGN